jgi:hypothetical protein
VPTTEKKDKWILGAVDELGTASAQDVADYWKVDSSKVREITAHMDGMCDRRKLVREDTPAGTVYSKATVGQTAPDLGVDVAAPAEPAAAPEAATAPDAVAKQDLAVLDAKIIECMAQGKSGYIPVAQAIGTTRDTVAHRMKTMLADGRLVEQRDADGCMMPRLPLPTSPAPAPAPTAPAKPMQKSGILPGESWHAYQHRKAFEAAEAAKPSRFS